MKIACLGDLHVRDSKPRYRIDDFKKTQRSKFRFIMNTCRDEGVSLILAPGDFFDRHTASNALVSEYLGMISAYGIQWGVVFGQHDLRYHSLKTQNTPLNILIKSRYVTQLSPRRPYIQEDVHIWGKSWGQTLPKPTMDGDKCNILVAHHMVIKNKKLWPDQTEYSKAGSILNNYDFDLFVFGDNHNHFVSTSQDQRHLMNCGSLMRTSVDQEDHKPCFYIFDTFTKAYERRMIPIDDFENVMDLKAAQEQNTELRKEDAQKFINKLKDTTVDDVSFKKNLQNAIEENRKHIRKGMVNVIEEALPQSRREAPHG